MIKITLLTPPYAGRVRELHGTQEVDPADLLRELVSKRVCWTIDWSQATREEAFLWGRADLVSRILRGLIGGRSVFFLGQEYRAEDYTSITEVAGVVEDAIVNSGLMVCIESDGDGGVRIGTGCPAK